MPYGKTITLAADSCRLETIHDLQLQTLEAGSFFPEEHPGEPELVWVLEGSLHAAADGRDWILEAGDLTVYAPGQFHVTYTTDEREARVLRFRFRGRGLVQPGLYDRKFADCPRRRELQRRILEELRCPDNGPELLICLVTELLILLQREKDEGMGEQARVRPENQIICRAQQYIRSHICERLSVPIVAEHARVSASYLTALFRINLHISPGEYIRRAKLQESRQLIRQGELNFTQIAEKLQYSTVHHFSRQFKEKFGISPTEYARTLRELE